MAERIDIKGFGKHYNKNLVNNVYIISTTQYIVLWIFFYRQETIEIIDIYNNHINQ